MGFRSATKSVTLNDLERRNDCRPALSGRALILLRLRRYINYVLTYLLSLR